MNKLLLFLLVALAFVSCKSPKFTAETKEELAVICIEQFPQVELERATDTIYEDREVLVPYQVDCDEIGIKEVKIPVKIKDTKIKETVTVRDTAKDFLVIMLQAEKESLEKQVAFLEDERTRIKQEHKKELKDKDKACIDEVNKANKFKNRLLGWGIGIIGVFVLIRFVLR